MLRSDNCNKFNNMVEMNEYNFCYTNLSYVILFSHTIICLNVVSSLIIH